MTSPIRFVANRSIQSYQLPWIATVPAVAASGTSDRSNGPDRRWFSPQPNVTGRGILASYDRRFWAMVLALGVAAGVAASAVVALLRLIERVSYGSLAHGYTAAVRATPAGRHVVVLLIAALIVGVASRVLGNMARSGATEVSEALWLRSGKLDFTGSIARGVLSIVTVAMGVSLGREAAPQLAGAATASKLADWAKLPVWQRRLLVASGAGAGFAAVYNVPLGGTLLAVEVLLGTLALPLVVPALVTSVTATAVAWVTLGTGPSYQVPSYAVHPSQLVWALIAGPLIGLAAVAWAQMVSVATQRKPKGLGIYLAPFAVFGALSLLSIPYPQLLGNGHDIVQFAVVGNLSIGLLAVLLALKPLVTSACVASGAPGGLFTPTFAVGALLAGLAGAGWTHLWHGAPVGSYALIGGGAFLAAAMQGPLAATVLVLELTRHSDSLMVPTLIAVAGATIVARRLGAQSIYSARLPSDPAHELRPSASAAASATLHALDEVLPPELFAPPPRSGDADSRDQR
jgi:chloride channel protein, CIC family